MKMKNEKKMEILIFRNKKYILIKDKIKRDKLSSVKYTFTILLCGFS